MRSLCGEYAERIHAGYGPLWWERMEWDEIRYDAVQCGSFKFHAHYCKLPCRHCTVPYCSTLYSTAWHFTALYGRTYALPVSVAILLPFLSVYFLLLAITVYSVSYLRLLGELPNCLSLLLLIQSSSLQRAQSTYMPRGERVYFLSWVEFWGY